MEGTRERRKSSVRICCDRRTFLRLRARKQYILFFESLDAIEVVKKGRVLEQGF